MSAASVIELPVPVTVRSDLLGTIEVDPAAVFTFPRGLLGFPECRSFVLVPSERDHVYWLQSADYPSLAFLVIDPFTFFEGYTVDLAATELARAPISPDNVTILAIVTLPRAAGDRPTANLQGPLVLDSRRSEGFQVIVADGRYGIRETLAL